MMGAPDAGGPAVASISFTSLSRQGRAEVVCQQPSNVSGNAYRAPPTALGFQNFRKTRVQKPPGFLFNKQQQARRWLSGIGVGNGGFIFVRIHLSAVLVAWSDGRRYIAYTTSRRAQMLCHCQYLLDRRDLPQTSTACQCDRMLQMVWHCVRLRFCMRQSTSVVAVWSGRKSRRAMRHPARLLHATSAQILQSRPEEGPCADVQHGRGPQSFRGGHRSRVQAALRRQVRLSRLFHR